MAHSADLASAKRSAPVHCLKSFVKSGIRGNTIKLGHLGIFRPARDDGTGSGILLDELESVGEETCLPGRLVSKDPWRKEDTCHGKYIVVVFGHVIEYFLRNRTHPAL